VTRRPPIPRAGRWAVLLLTAACASDAGDRSDAAAPSAEQALARAIAFHDPEGAWASARFELDLEESRPDGTVRRSRVGFDNAAGRFELRREHEGRLQEFAVAGDRVEVRLDGSADLEPSVAEELGLTPERALFWRDYYLYLYGLPMKLRDPGTLLDPEVRTVELDGRAALRLRVTYEEEVGGDTWYFYLAPESFELLAYRFHHDESKNDGELITLEGVVPVSSMRLPRERTWTTNDEGELLGVDTVVDARPI
jgi:hypothetical protein